MLKIKKNAAGENDDELFTSEWNNLPFLSIIFKNENEIIAGGYDYNPILFKEKDGKL